MTPAEVWLRGRGGDVPPALLERMVDALPAATGAVPDALVEGAIALYGAVCSGSGGREDALPLLAADALFTHAFEAQSELEPDDLEALVSRCEERLGEVAP